MWEVSNVRIFDSEFWNNQAGTGGVANIATSSVINIERSQFRNNHAKLAGAVIQASDKQHAPIILKLCQHIIGTSVHIVHHYV